MKSASDTSPSRFVAFDLHKHYVVVAAVNRDQAVVLKPRRLAMSELAAWAKAHRLPTDQVVLEATGNAWTVHDLLAPLVQRCVVADARQVKWIASAAVKTDRQDVLRLVKLLAAHLIPEVWVPPQPVRELRALMAHRRALVRTQTRVKNCLQSLLHRFALQPPQGEVFAEKNHPWWQDLPLSPSEHLRLHHDLRTLEHLQQQLAEVEAELARLSNLAPWKDFVPFLVQLPDFGLITAMTVLAAIGDIARFESAKKLVGYAGLGAGIHDSGETHQEKGITKSGRRDLRTVLVEAAWSAVETHPYWKREFQRLLRHKHKNQAIVAIARRLLVAVWHVLTERAADKNAVPKMVAPKLMRWSWELTPEQRGGLTTRQFVRYGLMRLRLGQDLSGFTYGGMPRGLASVEEILARFPELAEAA